jgi:hypothetical protein
VASARPSTTEHSSALWLQHRDISWTHETNPSVTPRLGGGFLSQQLDGCEGDKLSQELKR